MKPQITKLNKLFHVVLLSLLFKCLIKVVKSFFSALSGIGEQLSSMTPVAPLSFDVEA